MGGATRFDGLRAAAGVALGRWAARRSVRARALPADAALGPWGQLRGCPWADEPSRGAAKAELAAEPPRLAVRPSACSAPGVSSVRWGGPSWNPFERQRLGRDNGIIADASRSWNHKGRRRLARDDGIIADVPAEAPSYVSRGGPLERALSRPGFPRVAPLDPRLSAEGGFVHIPGLACPCDDEELVARLVAELRGMHGVIGKHRSGKHLQAFGERLVDSPTFTTIVARLLTVFRLTLVDCWINVYRDGSESKSWHHDNYRDRKPTPTVTIGLSLGSTRDLVFEEVDSGRIWSIPQRNGDVFAFDETFNRRFRHAVPPAEPGEQQDGPRISVMVWALEGEELAVPAMLRRGAADLHEEVTEIRWGTWDLAAGARLASSAFP